MRDKTKALIEKFFKPHETPIVGGKPPYTDLAGGGFGPPVSLKLVRDKHRWIVYGTSKAGTSYSVSPLMKKSEVKKWLSDKGLKLKGEMP